MKTNGLYVLTADDKRGVPLYSKMFLVSIILALIVASLPASRVFAAPPSVIETDDLAQEWENKVRNLSVQGRFYDQVQLIPADFDSPEDLARARDLLNRFGIALRQANTIVVARAGFDQRGRVTNERLAIESLNDLAENLRIMRAIRMKFAEQEYKFHFSR